MPKKPLISIVYDDDAMRDAMNGLMRALGFRVKTFASAEEFLKFSDLRNTACLVADVQMPRISGARNCIIVWLRPAYPFRPS